MLTWQCNSCEKYRLKSLVNSLNSYRRFTACDSIVSRIMYSLKLICFLAIISIHSIFVNGQFGGFGQAPFSQGPFFNSGSGSSGGFSNSNTNFQQNRGGTFGAIATFGSGQSNTNFQQQNSNGGKQHILFFYLDRFFSWTFCNHWTFCDAWIFFFQILWKINLFLCICLFSSGFNNFGFNRGGFGGVVRAADENENQSMSNFRYASPYDTVRYSKPLPPPPPAPAHVYPVLQPPVQCPHQLLVSCAPQVSSVPCSAAPPPPPTPYYWTIRLITGIRIKRIFKNSKTNPSKSKFISKKNVEQIL